jgi:hypothetical protein
MQTLPISDQTDVGQVRRYRMLKRIGIGILAAMVLAVSVAGIVLAQEPTPPADGETHLWGRRGGQSQALADALGIDVEEVHAALADTIAELAEAQGMTIGDLVDAIIAPMIERIQQAVDDGNITQEEADEQIAQMKEQMLEGLESGSGFGMGPGGFGGRPGGMRPGPRGDDAASPRFPMQEAPSVTQ